MTNSTKLLITLFFALFSVASQAQNFYVCDSNGSDDFDGRSEAKPFKTYDKAIWAFNKLDAGGSLLFCRGEKFEANIAARLVNSSCSASKPCTIGDYGNQQFDKPIISSNGVHAINFENGGDAKRDGGYVVKNLTLIAAIKSGAGIRLYNDVDDVTIQNVHVEGFNIGVYSADSKIPPAGSSANGFNDRLIVKDSTIINNKKIGFLGACNDCLIENNYFENNGTHPSLDHNIYLAQKNNPARGMTIRNNTLYRSAIVDGKCQGVSLVGHGLLEDVLIENNIIKEDVGKVTGGCWGISIDPGYSKYDEAFRNIVIRNNKIINVGGNGIGCASCEGVTIEGNEIIDEANMLTAGIHVPVREENTLKSKNIVVRNNNIILSHQNAAGIIVGGENPSQVLGNVIKLPTNTRSDCISLIGLASLRIDISSNSCNTHNGVSIIDSINDEVPNQDDEQLAETPIEQVPEEVEQGVPENEQVVDQPITQEPVIVDNSSEQEGSNQEVVDTENTEAISEPQLPSTDVAQTDGNITTDISQQSPTVSNGSAGGGSVSLNDSTAADSSLLNTKPRKAAAGGGSSGGGSSKAKTSSSSSTTIDTATSDDVITYSSTEEAITETSSLMSIETEQMDIINGLSKTEPESSKYSVKVKDVIEASRSESEVIDVTQCRAYAAGRCLMK